MEIITDIEPCCFKMLVYGPPGCGKTTLASQAPNPVLLRVEDGAKRIKCAKTPHLKTWDELWKALQWSAKCEYSTIVVDTLDYAETYLHEYICTTHGKKSLGDFDFGKGYRIATEKWSAFIKAIDHINLTKNVILLAHEQIKTYNDPTSNAYDRYSIKMHKDSASLVLAAMDCVFFMHGEKILREDDKNSDRKIACGTGRRVLEVMESPAWQAKNRFCFTERIVLNEGDNSHLYARIK